MESVISKENDYKQRLLSTPSYQLYPVYQQTGGTTSTLAVGGGTSITFELPSSVYNLAESSLRFTMTPTAGGSGNYNYIFSNFPFRQLTLTDSSGFLLCDIPDVFKYFDITKRHDINDQTYNTGLIAGSTTIPYEGIARLRESEAAASYYYGGGAVVDSKEPVYMMNGGSNTATPVLVWQFKMKLLVDTILALDKDLYFGKSIFLKLYSLPVNQIGYLAGASGATVVSGLTSTIALSSLEFDLAQQVNENLKNQAMSMFQNTEMYIPFVLTDRFTTTASTSQTLTKKYIPSDGKFIKRIVVVPYSATDSSSTTLDHNNISSVKVVSYQTKVNGSPTTQNILTCSNYDDYILFKDRLKGSMIISSYDYYYNWRHEEIFVDDGAIRDKPNPSNNLVGGLPISKEFNYDVKATTTNNSFNWYIFTIVYRKLIFNNGNLSYEN